MACKDDPYENSNPLQGLTFDCTTWWNEDLYTRRGTKNGCKPDWNNENLGSSPGYVPATWTENGVKFELKLSNQIGREHQKQTRWVWSGEQTFEKCKQN